MMVQQVQKRIYHIAQRHRTLCCGTVTLVVHKNGHTYTTYEFIQQGGHTDTVTYIPSSRISPAVNHICSISNLFIYMVLLFRVSHIYIISIFMCSMIFM